MDISTLVKSELLVDVYLRSLQVDYAMNIKNGPNFNLCVVITKDRTNEETNIQVYHSLEDMNHRILA